MRAAAWASRVTQPWHLKTIFLFIYLAVPGLSCGMLELQSLLRHAESLVVAFELLVAACGI